MNRSPTTRRGHGWTDCPPAVRAQVTELLDLFGALLGRNLVGVYLHGSLAMGCFNPARSDIDLLAVTDHGLTNDTKLGLVQTCLRRSGQPAPLELSVLARADPQPWRYPTPYQLHFSETWRERYEEETRGLGWLRWPEAPPPDPDLAAHIAVTRARGIALTGPPASEVFPEVPPEDYLASILNDVRHADEEIGRNPSSTVLNLCRVYRHLRDGGVWSKDEAGVWAGRSLPPALREVAHRALAAYRGRGSDEAIGDPDELVRFAEELLARIRALQRGRVAASRRVGDAPAERRARRRGRHRYAAGC